MNAVTEMAVPINFTDSAAGKVRELIEEEGNPALKLRVFVTGGGAPASSTDLLSTKKLTKTTLRWRKTVSRF